MPEWLWRILCVRYIFLIGLGWDIVTNGVRLSRGLLILSIFSIFFILCFYYCNPDLSPVFIHNGWKVEHWISYFYPAYLLLWCIRVLYDHTPEMIKQILSHIGVASYEIFLCQMFFFSLLDSTRVTIFSIKALNILLFLVLAWVFSLGGGLILRNMISRYHQR